MWTAILILSAILAAGAIGAAVFAEHRGFTGLSYFLLYLAGVLPAVSVATIVILSSLVNWIWVVVAVAAIGGLQFAGIVYSGNSVWTYCVVPVALAVVCALALRGGAVGRIEVVGPWIIVPVWFVAAGVVLVLTS